MTIHDFTYTGGDSGAPYQAQQYDRLDRAVTQAQYYFDSVRDWRQDVVNYATQARQDRDHIQTLGDTIVNTGEHIDTMVQVSVDAAETATTAASHTATDRQAAQTARTGAETAETNAGTHATASASSASSAADILTATEALGITVDTSVGTRVFVGDTMIHGDTGGRSFKDLIAWDNGWQDSITSLAVRRSNNVVTVNQNRLVYSTEDAGNVTLITLPSGFRPVSSVYGMTSLRDKHITLESSGNIVVSNPRTILDYFTVSFVTADPWPTSMPGTST